MAAISRGRSRTARRASGWSTARRGCSPSAASRKVTVRDICQAPRANVAAVNYHFGGKNGLYQEVVQTAIRTMLATTEDDVQAGRRPAARGAAADLRRHLPAARRPGARQLDPSAHDARAHRADARARSGRRSGDASRGWRIWAASSRRCSAAARRPARRHCVISVQTQCLVLLNDKIASRFHPFQVTPKRLEQVADHITTFSLASRPSSRRNAEARRRGGHPVRRCGPTGWRRRRSTTRTDPESERSDSSPRVRSARSVSYRISNDGACLYEAACQVTRLIAISQVDFAQTSSEPRRPLIQPGDARRTGRLTIPTGSSSSVPRVGQTSEVSHPSIRALCGASAPAHHTGCEWRSGAPCVPALTCRQGMHTRSLLQLDDQAVNSLYGRSRYRRHGLRRRVPALAWRLVVRFVAPHSKEDPCNASRECHDRDPRTATFRQ